MTTTTIKKPTSNTKVNKPVQQDIQLDLDRILEQVWNQGLPNDILNPI